MDEKIRHFIKRNKKLIAASWLIGFLVTPFLWPFFLAVIFSAIRLAVPVFLILLGIKMPCRVCRMAGKTTAPQNTDGETGKSGSMNDKKGRTDEYEQREKTISNPQGEEPESVSEPGSGGTARDKNGSDASGRKDALDWYHAAGRDGILRIAKRMEQDGYAGMTIQNDGLCFVKEGKGYKRVGAVRNFPEKQMEEVAGFLRRDGMPYSRVRGKYILIFWRRKKGGHR